MINWDRVNELRDEFGEGIFADIVAAFLEETDEVIERLRNTGLDSSVGETMHFLKGSALNLGFSEMADLSETAERAAANNHATMDMISKVISSYERTRSQFQDSLKPTFAA